MNGPRARTEQAAELLLLMRSKGVRIWAEAGQLRYQAARGTLTLEELERLRALKTQLVELLRQIEPRRPGEPIPLTFSQQLWWNCLELHSRPSMRTVAGAVRLAGTVDSELLQRCFSELVRRHESLRTRIVLVDGMPVQWVDEPGQRPLDRADLSHLPGDERTSGVRSLIQQIVHRPVSVATGPLFAATLIKVADDDHVLLVAMDHIVSDAASLGIVWREIFAPHCIPNRGVQFADYAVWQWKTQHHDAYWTKRLAGATSVRLTDPNVRQAASGMRWRRQTVQLGEDLSGGLRALAREAKTSLVMSCLAAYFAFLLRWCECTDLVVAFVTLGRLHPEVEQTIGYFSTSLFLRAELHRDDGFLSLLDRVIREYGTAYEHSDSGKVAAETPTPAFAWNPRFNWIPEELVTSPLGVEGYDLDILPREDCEWEGELELQLSDRRDGVSGVFTYRGDRFTPEFIENLAWKFKAFTRKLVSEPAARVARLGVD